METETIKTFLQKIGFSPKEIRVYLYCLSRGPQLVSQLAKVTSTTRTNTYDIVKKLESKGLCHTVGSTYGRKVKANDPKDIRDLLENKEHEIKSLKTELHTLLPLFQTNSADFLSPFTKVSYFEGADNVRKMIWLGLQSAGKKISNAGSELDMVASLGKAFVADFHTRRKSKGIILHALRPDSKRVEGAVFQHDKEYLREIRIRPKGEVRLKSNVMIWDTYVAFYSLKDKVIFGMLIESEDMATMLETWFDFIWERSQKING